MGEKYQSMKRTLTELRTRQEELRGEKSKRYKGYVTQIWQFDQKRKAVIRKYMREHKQLDRTLKEIDSIVGRIKQEIQVIKYGNAYAQRAKRDSIQMPV